MFTYFTSAFFLLLLSRSHWLSLLFTFIQSQQEHISIKKMFTHIDKPSNALFSPNTELFPAHIFCTIVQCLISSTYSSDIPVATHCTVQRKTSSHRAHGMCCSHMLGITVWTTCQEWVLSRSPLCHTQIKSVGCFNNCSTTSFIQMYTHTHTHIHIHTHRHMHIHTHTHTHTHTHACMQTTTHTHIHAHAHNAGTCTHTHTHTLSLTDTQHTHDSNTYR